MTTEEKIKEFTTRYHALMRELEIPRYLGVVDFGGNIFQLASGGGDNLWQAGVGEYVTRLATLSLLQRTQTEQLEPPTERMQESGGVA